MISEICTDQEEKLKQMLHTNLTFANGSTNFQIYKHATEVKENELATIAGKSIPMCKITLEVSADSPISSGLKKMGGKKNRV